MKRNRMQKKMKKDKVNKFNVEKLIAIFLEEINYGCQSKLIRCAILHEFIYYTVYKLNFNEGVPSLYDRFPLSKYLPPNTEPTSLESLPEVDKDTTSPYRHVVRIPPFKDAERGWFMVRDILQVSQQKNFNSLFNF